MATVPYVGLQRRGTREPPADGGSPKAPSGGKAHSQSSPRRKVGPSIACSYRGAVRDGSSAAWAAAFTWERVRARPGPCKTQ